MASGGFDPLHEGHLSYLKKASELGTHLLVVINDNNFLLNKKGYYVLDEKVRRDIINNFYFVWKAIIFTPSKERDNSVCEAINLYRPQIFAKGGDRHPDGVPIPEEGICTHLGVEIVYGVGGYDKANSSSDIIGRLKNVFYDSISEKVREEILNEERD
jgi:cytidyltransferase-like protein